MANLLTELVCTEISVVDKGANPGARIALFKRNNTWEPGYIAKRALRIDGHEFAEGDVIPSYWLDSFTSDKALKAGWIVENDELRALLLKFQEPEPKETTTMATEPITKRRAGEGIDAYVELNKRAGETPAAALLRLSQAGDAGLAELYDIHESAKSDDLADLLKAHAKAKQTDDEEDEEKLGKRARKIAKRDGCTAEQAYRRALEENPEIYKRMDGRRAERVAKAA